MSGSLALASLTENYTDSEGEEIHHHDTEPSDVSYSPTEGGTGSVTSVSKEPYKQPVSFRSQHVFGPGGYVAMGTVSNLVSYHDDTILSDEEIAGEKPAVPKVEVEATVSSEDQDVDLPPEPQGRCSNELQEKISRLHHEKILRGKNMNQLIQKRKDFRNPSIYEKLIQYCSIKEFGTNYSLDMYDPGKWGKSSYYDELAKLQKAEMDQKEKERREKTKVEFLMGTAKKTSSSSLNDEDGKKRKSKWDQVGSGSQAVVKPPGLLPLTSTATGTKGTVISAFGNLPKKPRA